MAIARLIEKGCQRIGFALPSDIDLRTAGMMSGSFLHARELRYPKKLTRPFLKPFGSFNRDTFNHWLEKEKPDAVIGIIWGGEWLKDSEIPWINLDLKPEDTNVTGVQQNPKRIGAAAVDLVTAHWLRQDTGIPEHPKTSLIEGEWVP
jgi:DNA-binding LacI/PurR family transcriptional regulator